MSQKTQNLNENPDAEVSQLLQMYESHDTLGISEFLIKHKTDPKFSSMYGKSKRPFTSPYDAVKKYLVDTGNLSLAKKASTKTENPFVDKIKRLKIDYETGNLPADKVYSQLRVLEEEFDQSSDDFYTLYGELELLTTTRIEAETRERVGKNH